MTKLKALVGTALLVVWAMAGPARGTPGSTLSYLIVTSNELKPAFMELASYREAIFGQGKTAVVTVEEIYRTVTGSDNPEKIFNYLKTKKEHEELQYVLLGGDDTVVPVKTEETHEGEVLYDGYYADVADDPVIVGRLPVRRAGEASAYISKLKAYEQSGREKTAAKIFLSGAKMNGVYLGEDRPADMVNDGMAQFQAHLPLSDAEIWVRRLYRDGMMVRSPPEEIKGLFDTVSSWDGGDPGSYKITGDRLRERLSQGWEAGIHYSGGDATSLIFDINLNSRFTRDQALAMSGLVGAFLSASGYGGAFDDANDPCLAEALLRNPAGGSLVYIGSSRKAPFDTEDFYGGGFAYFVIHYYRYLLTGSAATHGEAFKKAKAYLSKEILTIQGDFKEQIRYYLYALNFLGDPALPAPAPAAWSGSMTWINASQVAEVGETFWSTPSARASGNVWQKPASSRLKSVSHIRKGIDTKSGKRAVSALFEWQPWPALWDKRVTLANVEAGKPVYDALVRRGQVEMDLSVSVATPSGGRVQNASAGAARMFRPVIQSVAWDSDLKEGTEMFIGGAFFGKKIPKVYLERLREGKRVWVSSKVMPFYAYPDAYSNVFSSVTDPLTGEAVVYCVYPGLGPNETDTGWVILETDVGIDAFPFLLIK